MGAFELDIQTWFFGICAFLIDKKNLVQQDRL